MRMLSNRINPIGVFLLAMLSFILGGCGGGGGGGFTEQTQETTGQAPEPVTLEIATSALPDGKVNYGYLAALEVTNAPDPDAVLWTIDGGGLPPGLALEAPTGLIKGTPAALGTFLFSVKVEDTTGQAQPATRTLSITINDLDTLAIVGDLPDGKVGQAYLAELQADNKDVNSVLKWSVSNGAFPLGLQLNATTGLVDGTPTATGTYQFILKVEDTKNLAKPGTQQFEVVISVGTAPPANPVSLGLRTSQITVKSDNSDRATLTASVLDQNNAGIKGVAVAFTADGGQLNAASALTDDFGNATVTLGAGNVDRSNRIVNITATVGNLSRVIPIQVVGNTLQLTIDNTALPSDGTRPALMQLTLQDAGPLAVFDAPVCIASQSSDGGSVSIRHVSTDAELVAPCPIANVSGIYAGKTDVNGRLQVRVRGVTSGQVSLTVVAAGAAALTSVVVQTAGQVFEITSPSAGAPPALVNTGEHTVVVNAPGSTVVTFSSSLGTWSDKPGALTPGQPLITVAVVNGQATAYLKSTIAGTANVQAQDADISTRTDSVLVNFTASLKDAKKLLLDASPRVLKVATPGVVYSSTLVAKLLTATDQPIAGAIVTFSLLDTTGGGEIITPPVATTNTAGEAQVTFRAGTQASSAEGIRIQAQVTGPDLSAPLTAIFRMVISSQAGSVVIGNAHVVESINNNTAYRLPMSVLVADINGSPVSGAEVSLSVWPLFYHTGFRDDDGNCIITGTFANEDKNENTILESGEDTNGDGKLTPPSSAAGALPASVKADDAGLATYDLVYLKQSACWISARARASARVGGSEIVSELVFVLPYLETEARFLPPSPYGVGIPATARIGIATDRTTVKSDNSEAATITVSVLANTNAGIPGVVVSFTADGGQISQSNVTTDDQGIAKTEFRSGIGDKSNRVVTVTASSGAQVRTIPIRIIGTTLQLSADATSLPEDGSASTLVNMTLLDAGSVAVFDAPVCVEQQSTNGGVLSLRNSTGQVLATPCPLSGVSGIYAGNTNVDGKLTIQVRGVNDGDATLTARAGGVEATQNFAISPVTQLLTITAPLADAPPQLIGTGSFVFNVSAPGARTVIFSSSLGTWQDSGSGACLPPFDQPTIECTVRSNQATAQLQSAVAGIANVLVRDKDNLVRTDSQQVTFTSAIDNAAKLTLQASSRVVPISVGGVQNTSTLVAKLTTADDQAVANAIVSFTLLDPAGGAIINPPAVVTGSNGEGRATFISGTEASAGDGITIEARVVKPNGDILTNVPPFRIIVTDKAGSVTIGTSTTVESIAENTSYRLPMSVLVSDVNGNPISGALVNLSAWPSTYRTGFRTRAPAGVVITDAFSNEDINENTVKEADEDKNGDGELTPRNTTAGQLPSTVTTGPDGLATFSLVYLKDFATWIVTRVRASTLVGGTEIISERLITLPTSVTDFQADPPVLRDSPFNSICPFVAFAEPTIVEVPLGESAPVTVTLLQRDDTVAPVKLGVAARPVQGFVTNATGTITTSNGVTDAAGQAIPEISAAFGDLVTDEGDSALVTYHVSCVPVAVNARVKAFTANILSNQTAGDKTIQVGQSLDFTGVLKGRGTSFDSQRRYQWTFGGGTPDTGNELSPGLVQFNAVGVYQVTFTITEFETTPELIVVDGLSDFDTITVTVQ